VKANVRPTQQNSFHAAGPDKRWGGGKKRIRDHGRGRRYGSLIVDHRKIGLGKEKIVRVAGGKRNWRRTRGAEVAISH